MAASRWGAAGLSIQARDDPQARSGPPEHFLRGVDGRIAREVARGADYYAGHLIWSQVRSRLG